VFFTLGLSLCTLAFLVDLAFNLKSQNKVDANTTLREDQVKLWGEIPGYLKFNFDRVITLYNYDSTVSLTSQAPIEMSVMRSFKDPTWEQTQSTVKYSEKYTYTNSTDMSYTVRQTNLAATSAWYQMTNKPQYWEAWQALTQIANMMYGANIVNSYYTVNAFYFTFQDFNLVKSAVIPSLSSADQLLVYNDSVYGMSDSSTLTTWVLANLNGSDSIEYKALIKYFRKKGVELEALMPNIVGPMSMMGFMNNAQRQTIINTYSHGDHVDDTDLVAIQWGTGGFLNNPDTNFKGTPPVPSLGYVDKIFIVYPEFGVWVQQQGLGEECGISNDLSRKFFLKDTSSETSLLNPQNMNTFYKLVDEQEVSALMTRFGFTNECQISSMKNYLNDMVKTNLRQGTGSREPVAIGQLIATTINKTWKSLVDNLPIQLSVRNLAQILIN